MEIRFKAFIKKLKITVPTNITTELLGEHPALESAATDLELTSSWIRGGDGLIGFGEWKSTSVKGKNRFTDARKWWHEQLATLKIQNNVHFVSRALLCTWCTKEHSGAQIKKI